MDEKTVLIIDEEDLNHKVLEVKMKDVGFKTFHARGKTEALKCLRENTIDIVFCDVLISGQSGFDILRLIRKNYRNVVVIMMTAFANLKTAIKTYEYGAFDYLIKPFTMDEIPFLLNRAVMFQEVIKKEGIKYLSSDDQNKFQYLTGLSEYIKNLKRELSKMSSHSFPVILMGPVGTGKKILAKMISMNYLKNYNNNYYYINLIHSTEENDQQIKKVFSNDFIDQNKIQTFIIDHSDLLDFNQQEFVVHNIQKEVKYLFITNKKINRQNYRQFFKEEFYKLIRENQIQTKSLKEHKEDIPLLINYFLDQYNRKYNKNITEVEKDALSFLLSYSYPENILELERIIEKIVMIADGPIIKLELLNQFIRDHDDIKVMILNPTLKYKEALKLADSKVDRYYFHMALKLTNYNKTKAAKLLNISLRQFQYKCRELGM